MADTGKNSQLTCCVITTAANEVVRPVLDRMPFILTPGRYADWLDPQTPLARFDLMSWPYPADEPRETPVGPAVNSPKNDGPECLALR